MNVIVIGATGTIGAAIAAALRPNHTVIPASRHSEHKVDILDSRSIAALLDANPHTDAVICAAGDAVFKPLADLTDADFTTALSNKLMGQVNVIRCALPRLRPNGAILITTGILGARPMPGGATFSLANGALEAFTRAAALEAPHLRINAISPPWIAETVAALHMPPQPGALPAAHVARTYVAALEGTATGQTIVPS
ncbi:MAG: short chain dehydrogenase [Deltaproteobacteria bacterium]|nr:short chain dehydrogenase [Deltaproteobacteria bacterium]